MSVNGVKSINTEEIERIIDEKLNNGQLPASLSLLQQTIDQLQQQLARNSRKGNSVLPINDITDENKFGIEEKLLRCKLAAVYRLVDLNGWSEGIYNHITARVSAEHEHFLLNPFGLHYDEITASALLKVDLDGNVLDYGSTNFSFNRAGFVLHSAIHEARPDIRAIIHLHHPPCVAVSSMKCGLLNASQESVMMGDVSYYDYGGLLIEPSEKAVIGQILGQNKVLILRNHGVVTCGETLEEALYLMHNLILACETQIRVMSIGLENLKLMSDSAAEHVKTAVKFGGLSTTQGLPSETGIAEGRVVRWKLWDLEFEAQMRMLDNLGYRTGYAYRQPLLRGNQLNADADRQSESLDNYLEDETRLLKELESVKRAKDKQQLVNA